jgi:hypothetical protein
MGGFRKKAAFFVIRALFIRVHFYGFMRPPAAKHLFLRVWHHGGLCRSMV